MNRYGKLIPGILAPAFLAAVTVCAAPSPLDRSLLPQGPLHVGAVDFTAGTPIELDSAAAKPVVVADWPQGRKSTGLAFLQTYLPGRGIDDWRAAVGLAYRKLQLPPDWPTVFSYEVEYDDGAKVIIPVRFGEGIEQWYRVQTVAPMLWARNCWTRALDPKSTEKLVVYAMCVPNPRPDQAIRKISASPAEDGWRDYGQALILAVSPTLDPLTGKLYFVDRKPVGDDTQTGAFDQPFGSIQHALDVARPGDSIYLRGAYYAIDAPLIKPFNGEQGKWLTISAFPGETPVIDAFGVNTDPRVKPYGPGPDRPEIGRLQHDSGALHISGDPDYTCIQGLHIYNSRRAGISVYGRREEGNTPERDRWAATDHIEIAFNTTYRSYSMGIISHLTDDLAVIGNRIIRPHALEMVYDPRTGEKVTEVALPQEAIDLSINRRFTLAFNTVMGGAKEAIDCIHVEDGRIEYNTIDSCLNGIYIDGWTVPNRRLDIHHNFIHNAFNGIPLSTEGGADMLSMQIHHNIVLNSKSGAIGVSEATYKAKPAHIRDHVIDHNTVVDSGRHAIAIGWQASGIGISGFRDNKGFRNVAVRDNIVADTVGQPIHNVYSQTAKEHDVVVTHNLVWPTSNDTTPEWMRVAKKGWVATDNDPGVDTIVKDPRFVAPASGDYRLQKGSPAIGAGTDGSDLGALPYGQAWAPGLDFAGHVTCYYRGQTVWQPVDIATEKYTMHRNNLQRPSWFQRSRYGPDFRDLPSGEQCLAGITWRIADDAESSEPSVMALSGIESESPAESITGITVGRKADRLAFLHTVHIAADSELKDGDELFHYRVHYADGNSVDIPVRLGEDVAHWCVPRPKNLPDARLAWTEKNILKSDNGAARFDYIALYCMEWTNPRPDVAVQSIDIVRDADKLKATPAVFAISTGIVQRQGNEQSAP